jgi:hypothetical protein
MARLFFDSSQGFGAVPRQCLGNSLGRRRQKKQAHLFQIVHVEATAKALPEILSKAPQQLLPARRARLPALFKLDNSAANFPIAGGHQGIDAARGGAAGRFQQFDDVGVDGGVVSLLRVGGRAAVGHARASISRSGASPQPRGCASTHPALRIPITQRCILRILKGSA